MIYPWIYLVLGLTSLINNTIYHGKEIKTGSKANAQKGREMLIVRMTKATKKADTFIRFYFVSGYNKRSMMGTLLFS
jgi:hypothetical protein